MRQDLLIIFNVSSLEEVPQAIMIHELLLALSGHSSPLFSESTTPLTSQLSSAELALLKQLGNLGHLHRDTRLLAALITESHDSVICRAVAASISNTQLSVFQQKILSVERSILSKDSCIVGAYDIVPLSGIAKAFAGWSRRIAWLKEACEQMRDEEGAPRSGAHMIDWLRAESRTGFPDLELVILDLIDVAEKAWLRQLSIWMFYGRLPRIGSKDFLVQGESEGGSEELTVKPSCCPIFVTPATARSILFIGRSLNSVKKLDSTFQLSSERKSILMENMASVSSLKHPIASASLLEAVGKIRRSLAQSILQNLLPSIEVVKFLNILQEFFLGTRGEFSVALVDAADLHLRERHLSDQKSSNTSRLVDKLIKDSDIVTVLRKTWAALTRFQNINDDKVDGTLEFAREVIQLHIRKRIKAQGETGIEKLHAMFDDTLLAIPVALTVQPSSMFSLFFTMEHSNIYSMIHAYLISLRRTHIHLRELWKLSVLRRYRFSPGTAISGTKDSANRVWWAAVFSATFFITELCAYFQGEVIAESWTALQQWISKDDDGERDPETIGAAHHVYLSMLRESLLLNHFTFAEVLRQLMDNCNQIVALARRLELVRQALEAFHSKAEDTKELPSHLVDENREIKQDLILASQAVNKSLKDLMVQLKDMDTTRTKLGFIAQETVASAPGFATSFIPWKGSGIRSLLMKLDLQAISND
ncbi:MAG: hypothetical protein GOMPHAMPRED_000523 [Gomphillus americanus]|uniref:Spindle pole body component n=1 Tax=Gomphillus americanus TaxID=1940652 RepID=A0A8H3I567_9LECA|nr:MAG: hypothetical protein GOMPHAMPRED_000523 [Gomphillus americanus]